MRLLQTAIEEWANEKGWRTWANDAVGEGEKLGDAVKADKGEEKVPEEEEVIEEVMEQEVVEEMSRQEHQ